MTSIVSLKNVSKTYRRGRTAVGIFSDLNLEIPPGEFLALMGPSGSGKTTLLNLISGLDRPDRGEIDVSGKRIDRLSGRRLAQWRSHNIGFVFQFYNLLPTLNARRNIELPLLLTSLSGAERRRHIDVALEIVGLSDRARHRPSQLSGGEQQRVAIARALVADPALLACDEPTGDLDRATADQILELLRVLSRDHGKTVVMVTHDQKAASFATRQLHLDKGRLVEDTGSRPAT
jgi:putative ABC transport system ATP-binding protein